MLLSVCLGRACSYLMAGRVFTPLRLLASSGSDIASKGDIASQVFVVGPISDFANYGSSRLKKRIVVNNRKRCLWPSLTNVGREIDASFM